MRSACRVPPGVLLLAVTVACAEKPASTPPDAATGGAEYRIVVDFAEPDRFLAIQNIGNSGQPGSPHYADQFDSWRDGAYHTVHLTRAGVEADLAGTTRLEPPG